MAYGLAIQGSSDVWIYSTGLYSFFNTWGSSCIDPKDCQLNIIYADTTNTRVHAFAISTFGTENMIYPNTSTIYWASANTNTFCSTAIVDLNLF